jgi:hypothetical protein
MKKYLLVTGILFGVIGVTHVADVAERWRTLLSQPLQLAVPLAGIGLTILAWRSARSGGAGLARAYLLISGALFSALAGEHMYQFVKDIRSLEENPWFIAANVLVLMISIGLAVWAFQVFRVVSRPQS